jgi:hypothetical protein
MKMAKKLLIKADLIMGDFNHSMVRLRIKQHLSLTKKFIQGAYRA